MGKSLGPCFPEKDLELSRCLYDISVEGLESRRRRCCGSNPTYLVSSTMSRDTRNQNPSNLLDTLLHSPENLHDCQWSETLRGSRQHKLHESYSECSHILYRCCPCLGRSTGSIVLYKRPRARNKTRVISSIEDQGDLLQWPFGNQHHKHEATQESPQTSHLRPKRGSQSFRAAASVLSSM
jgi:hypothetical protein